jgi:hypothetical protein
MLKIFHGIDFTLPGAGGKLDILFSGELKVWHTASSHLVFKLA